MEGVSLKLDEENSSDLIMSIKPGAVKGRVGAESLVSAVKQSDYADFFILEEAVATIALKLKNAQQRSESAILSDKVAEKRDADIKFVMDGDEMAATLVLTSPYGGSVCSLDEVSEAAKNAGIVRGIGKKRIKRLIDKIKHAEPGIVV